MRIVGEIDALIGIGAKIEKLIGIGWRMDDFMSYASSTRRGNSAFRQIFAPGGRLRIFLCAIEQWIEAAPVDLAGEAGFSVRRQIGETRQHIAQCHRFGHSARLEVFRLPDDERHMR